MELFGSGGVILVVLALVLFGAKRLPEMARSLGQAQGEFRKGLREGHIEDAVPEKPDEDVRPGA